MREQWRALVYHGRVFSDSYEVSNLGRIRNRNTGTVLKTYTNSKGYAQVCISKGRDRKIVVKVHRAVAETFLGDAAGMVVNHKDGVKSNNRVENLEWCTCSANTKHAWDLGLFPDEHNCGEGNGNAKLTAAQVAFIREHYVRQDPTFGTRALARRFGVDHMTISRALHGETWS